MKILAFLQNQWVHDPERVREMIARNPACRQRLIAHALFAGCKSGSVLRQFLGEWCDEIVWEEASPEIGGKAASSFPADPKHMLAAVQRERPTVVITLGAIALRGWWKVVDGSADPMGVIHIPGPHPTNRDHGNVAAELTYIRRRLDGLKV